MTLEPEKVRWLAKLGGYTGGGSASPVSDTVSAPVIDLPMDSEPEEPDRHVEHDTSSDKTEPIRINAKKRFPDEVDTFVNLWLTAGIDALAGAPEADDPESKAGWWVALVGDLVWAAASLNPEAKLLNVILSFSGATAGAGVFSPEAEKAPSGKKMISAMLTQARDRMVTAAGPVIDLAATQCGDKQIDDPEGQRQVLWRNLFTTPYNAADPIRQRMSAKIEAGLKSYNEQWHAWKNDLDKYVYQEAAERLSKGAPILNIVPTPDDYERVKKEHPFQPKLDFG